MKRRRFLLLTGLAAGSVVVPASLYLLSPGIKQYAQLLIERELNYLKLEPGSVSRYVEDYFNATGNNLVSRLKWKTMYYLNFNWEKSDQILELIKYYLLSSDFFINKTDERKTVHYLGLYSPYKSPVPNPFSFALYPEDQVAEP